MKLIRAAVLILPVSLLLVLIIGQAVFEDLIDDYEKLPRRL
jgi:hypothetical protein